MTCVFMSAVTVKGNFTYAIADLHGRFDLLQRAYAKIVEHAGGRGRIIHLGDYVDRGPQSRQVIEFLMDPITVPAGMRRIVLRGNHEDIMLHCCRAKPSDIRWWLGNGGNATLISYGQEVGDAADPDRYVPRSHLDWIAGLPYYAEDEHRVYVHASVDPEKSLEEQTVETLTWTINPRGDGGGYRDRHVVHGHEQQRNGPELYAGRTNLDTGAFYTNRLVIGVFDDAAPGGPIDVIEVIGVCA